MPTTPLSPLRSRITRTTIGVLPLVGAVVVVVYHALPAIPAPVYPIVFTCVAALLTALGLRARRRGQAEAARAWAAWAGFLSALLALAWSNLLGWGGALSTTLLVVLILNTVLAALFRSGTHLAVVVLGSLVLAALAFLYGIPPIPVLVFVGIGLWWIGAIGFSAPLVVSVTIALPIGAALLVHPLTHSALAIDGGDVATLAGLIAVASLLGSVITRAVPDPRIWAVQRATIVVALVAQALLGSFPAVAEVFRPETPLPGLLVGLCGLLAATGALVVFPHRAGARVVLGYAALLWASVAASVFLPAPFPALLVPCVLLLVCLRSAWRADPRSRSSVMATIGAVALGALVALLAETGPLGSAGILAATGAAVLVVTMRPRPVPPCGPSDAVSEAHHAGQ